MPHEVPHVELAKETKKQILDALKGIRGAIVKTQHRENTMADVAADALASGQSLAGAAKEALGFKRDKLKASFKRKFDPLNIVHRITGGSKLATALAGKVMGRSEQSIRRASGLQELAPPPTPFMGDQGQGGASPMGSGETTQLLEKMATTLSEIFKHLTRTQKLTEAREDKRDLTDDQRMDALQRIADEAEDKQVLAGAGKEASVPAQVNKEGKPVKKEGGIFDTIMKWLGPMLLPLGVALAGLAVAGVALYKNFDKIKLSLGFLWDSIEGLWQSIKDGVSSLGTFISNTYDSITDTIMDAGEALIEGVKSLNPFYTAPTDEEKRADLEKAAKAEGPGGGRATRKLAKEQAPQSKIESVVKMPTQTVGGNLKDIPKEKMAAEADALRKGEYNQEALGALGGLGKENVKPISGSPERIAVGGALTQKVAKSYEKLYGKTPSKDTEEARAKRLPAIVQAAATQLATEITAPSATGGAPGLSSMAPSELSATAPVTGQTLTQANDMQRDVAMAPIQTASGGGNNTVVNNIKNNHMNSTTVHQGMSPARSGESSFLRSKDKGYAPA